MAELLAPEGLAEVLRTPWAESDVTSLRNAIYLRAFARDLAGHHSPGPGLSIPNLTRLLSVANQGRDRWESGWRIEQVAQDGAIVAVSGERRGTFKTGEYALTFAETLLPRAGMAATVWFARESLTLQPGVYYAFGDTVPKATDGQDALRVYFHSPEDLLPDLYFHLTSQLNRLEIPFTLKTLLALADRDRSDATVLYLARPYWLDVEVIIRQLPGAVLSGLRPRTPLFTLRLAPGIGMADSPGGGESFGMHRCRLLAESILEARRSGQEDEESRLRTVRRRFWEAGIDLAHPHLRFCHTPAAGAVAQRIVLSATNIAAWLQDCGLISMHDGEKPWRVRTHNSRNRNFAVLREDGSGYFIKQLRVQGSESLRMMEREAALYGLFAASGSLLKDIAPAFIGFDREAQVLVLELEAETNNGSPARPYFFSLQFAKAVAKTLALLHRQRTEDLAVVPYEFFERRPPGIYNVHRGGPLLRWLGMGQLRLVDRVRQNQALASALDRMFTNWRCVHLIHGDVKWENCLWRERPTGAATLKWIDWELADLGDPAWDAGCFVQAYLSHWIRSFPPRPEWGLTVRLQECSDSFSQMQPAVQAFLKEYIAALKIGGSEVAGLRERIMSCAAARMVQMGLEVMHGQAEPTPEARCLLETSAELIAQPGEFLSRLDC
jgi:aminoglycoside phosphotransferase (APT) family kinase protein